MNKKIPLRQCVGCNEMKSKKEMLRVLKTAEEEVVLDTTGKMNGRGAYLCKNAECLKKAMKHKGIERSLKMAIEKSVYEKLEKEFLNIESELIIDSVPSSNLSVVFHSLNIVSAKAYTEGPSKIPIIQHPTAIAAASLVLIYFTVLPLLSLSCACLITLLLSSAVGLETSDSYASDNT